MITYTNMMAPIIHDQSVDLNVPITCIRMTKEYAHNDLTGELHAMEPSLKTD